MTGKPPLSGQRVLVIRPCAIGDALLTLPAIHALHRAGAEQIVVLGTPGSWQFLPGDIPWVQIEDYSSAEWLGLFAVDAPLADRAKRVVSDLNSAVVYLRDQQDACERALMRAGIGALLQIEPPQIDDCAEDVAMISSGEVSPDRIPKCHATRLLLDPLSCWVGDDITKSVLRASALGLNKDQLLSIAHAERTETIEELPIRGLDGGAFFCMHPGSGGRRKCWPTDRFTELAGHVHEQTGMTPLVLTGPADEEVRDCLRSQWPLALPAVYVHNHPLRSVVALLASSRFYLGNDSGVTHLAARCCPTVALFGPTDARVWRPLGEDVRVVCAELDGMETLSVEAVLGALPAVESC